MSVYIHLYIDLWILSEIKNITCTDGYPYLYLLHVIYSINI